MDKETLMAEAKRRYPEGTIIKCVNNNTHDPEDVIIKHSGFQYLSDPLGIHHGNAWVVLRGKWAEIKNEPFAIGGYVRAIVDGNTDQDTYHNNFKKGDIFQIKSINADGLVNYDEDGPRLYNQTYGSYPKECEWSSVNSTELLLQEESLVEVINNFPIY